MKFIELNHKTLTTGRSVLCYQTVVKCSTLFQWLYGGKDIIIVGRNVLGSIKEDHSLAWCTSFVANYHIKEQFKHDIRLIEIQLSLAIFVLFLFFITWSTEKLKKHQRMVSHAQKN